MLWTDRVLHRSLAHKPAKDSNSSPVLNLEVLAPEQEQSQATGRSIGRNHRLPVASRELVDEQGALCVCNGIGPIWFDMPSSAKRAKNDSKTPLQTSPAKRARNGGKQMVEYGARQG